VPPGPADAAPDDRVVGYVGRLDDYEGLTVTALETIWRAGGTVVDDAGRVLPHDGDINAVRRGLDRLRCLDPDLFPLDETGSVKKFRTGHALFMRNWPIAYRSLSATAKDGKSVNFKVTSMPGGSATLGGQSLAISARTTRPHAARALIEFLTNERSEQILLERGGLPATRDVVYTDPRSSTRTRSRAR
jgi:multiple sugar transport system substrate-binding protein